MKIWQKFLSDDPQTVAEGVERYIRQRPSKQLARTGSRYYEGQHDILDASVVTVDEHGKPMDSLSTNFLIPHPFLQEHVDQKVQYLLANGVQVEVDPNKDLTWLEEELEKYYDSDFRLHLNELVEGASVKGVEYAYVRVNGKNELKFEISDYLHTDTIFNDLLEEVAVVRNYTRRLHTGGKEITVEYAEVWTAEWVYFFVKTPDDRGYRLDTSFKENPRAHVVAQHVEDDDLILERSYGRIPFYRLTNNRSEASDLKPIKPLIDDYDRIASTMSSVIEDYDRPLYFIYGANKEDLAQFKDRVKQGGVIGVNSPNQQGVDMKHFRVDVAARKEKLSLNKELIYKFGMAFDSSQVGDGNTTNVVVRSRYSLLDLKCNKIEPRILAYLRWTLEVVAEDIQRKSGRTFDLDDVSFTLERNVIFNETDSKRQENLDASTKALKIQTALATLNVIDDESVIKLICDALDLDSDEVLALVEEDGFLRLEEVGAHEPVELSAPTSAFAAEDGEDD